jgi:hypothetical protein
VIADWNVAFKVLRGGAGLPIHVSAVGYDPEGGVYVMVDPHRFAIEVRALSPAEFDRWAALQFMLGGEVYRIAAPRGRRCGSPACGASAWSSAWSA